MNHDMGQTSSEQLHSGTGTTTATGASASDPRKTGHLASRLRTVGDFCKTPTPRLTSGMDQLDEALGGGLAEGALYLIRGSADEDRQALALAIAGAVVVDGESAVMVCTWRPTRDVHLEGKRAGAPADLAVIGSDHVESMDDIEVLVADQHPRLLVIDSLDISVGDVSGAKGRAARQADAARRLAVVAREHRCAVLVLAQATPWGTPLSSEVEYIVDVVVDLHRDEQPGRRVLTVGKNRFGPVGGQASFEARDAAVIPASRD